MKRVIIVCFFILFNYLNIFAQVGYNVEVLPTNVGGKGEFKRVFEQELIYPESLLKNKTGGKVSISFDLKSDSSVSNIVIKESGIPELDTEALRLFKLFLWVPAVKEGKFVSTGWTAVFDFDPDRYPKICKQRGFKNFKYLDDSQVDSTGKVYSTGVQMPSYQKGNFALQDFIKENLEYPRQAQLSNIQGTVLLSFVVEPSGLMTNIGVERSVGGGCDQEAIRVLQQLKWYPGKRENKLARVKMSFPFYFILNEDFKDNSAGEQK